MASPESPRSLLSKEVLPPQKPQNGVGVMVVAAAAMFFAVASSALILRSRMANECCPTRAVHSPPVIVDVAIPSATPAEAHCGEPVYQQLVDGTISITYKACPPGTDNAAAVVEQPVAKPARGIEIGRIEAPTAHQ